MVTLGVYLVFTVASAPSHSRSETFSDRSCSGRYSTRSGGDP
jgi:hypothetical protein